MALSIADRVLDTLDEIRRGFRGWTKADHSQYFPFGCAHNKNVLALYSGSLVSVIALDGYMGQYIPDQFEKLRTAWEKFFQNGANDQSSKGFDLFWSYEYDPEGMVEFTQAARERMVQASLRRGLDVRDVIEEEATLYGGICAKEQQFIFVVTHLDALPKADHKAARSRNLDDSRAMRKGAGSGVQGRGLKVLEAIHEQHVNKLTSFLEQAPKHGYAFTRLNAAESLKMMRHSMAPSTTGRGWSPKLTARDCRIRATDAVPHSVREGQRADTKPLDWTFMMPPSLAEQMVPDGVIDLGKYVVVEDRIYAPLYVSELAVEPRPIEEVLSIFYKRRLPVRIVYSLMANSDQANYWNRMFASMFTFASASNRQITAADKAMKAYKEHNGSVFGYGLSIVTWAKADIEYDLQGNGKISVAEIQSRAQDVETLMQQWGGQQLTSTFGCSVEAVMSATPGYMLPPTCPLAPQIESDVLTQLPLMRPAKLWDERNSIWLRSKEGVLSPYQPMSSRMSSMLTLVMGGMGFGKSNLISEHIFYFANHPEADSMPYIRGMDFGASSSGVMDMIKSSLPENRKHEAMFENFTNDGTLVKNLFDTRQGCRYPLADHKSFLLNFLSILCDDVIGQLQGVANVMAVLDASVDRAYLNRDNRETGAQPTIYRHETADKLVAAKVEEYNIRHDEFTSYWEVVDDLNMFGLKEKDKEALHAAKIAQRNCSPLLSDLVTACAQLTKEFVDAPMVDGKPLTSAIANSIQNSNRLFPCFAGITNTDISEARVCVFDMSSVFGRGIGPSEDFRRSVFFAAAFRLLTEDLFVSKLETGRELHERRKHFGLSEELVAWHNDYLERQDQVMKVFWGDELHRIGKVGGAFQIINSMAYEGRKYKVGIMLGTQMPEHFPGDMVKLATTVFIFGAAQSSENAATMQNLFDLTDAEREIIAGITKPNPSKGAEVFAIYKLDTRIQKVLLHFNLGKNKLWGYATGADERALRSILYKRGASTSWARGVLAKNVPNLGEMMRLRMEGYGETPPPTREIIEEIAKELLSRPSDSN